MIYIQNIFQRIKHLSLWGFGVVDITELEQKLHFPELETLKIKKLSYLKYFGNIFFSECKKLRSVTIEEIES